MADENNVVPPKSNEASLIGKTHIGYVKWFDNKRSYGFITVEHDGVTSDIFVHHTGLLISTNMYRYLVQGEYVQFECVETQKDDYKWQAKNVTGVHGGKLMCETRNDARINSGQRTVNKTSRSVKAKDEDGFQTIVKGRQR